MATSQLALGEQPAENFPLDNSTPLPASVNPDAPADFDESAYAKSADLQELQKSVEALSKRLTVITATEDVRLIFGGQVTADFLLNSARPFASGTPFFLAPELPSGSSQYTFDAHARQTALYALITGPKICDTWEPSAFAYVNFYNDAVIVDRYGLLPIQAFGQLKNDSWRLAAGLQFDIFNPLNPTMLPFSVLTGSGNAGSSFRGQARVEHFLYPSKDTQVTFTAGISEPIATGLSPDFRLSEDNGWPNVEGRMAFAFGELAGEGPEAVRPVEFGVSSVVGQIRTSSVPTGRVVADVWGLGADARVAFTPRFGVKGELFIGQAFGTYGGGILQNTNSTTFNAVRATGGWAEVYYYLCPDKLHTHVGGGVDNPDANDVAAGQLIQNETIFTNLIWDVTKYFRIGGEVTYRDTEYKGLPGNDGVGFQTQVQWKF